MVEAMTLKPGIWTAFAICIATLWFAYYFEVRGMPMTWKRAFCYVLLVISSASLAFIYAAWFLATGVA